MGQLDGGIDHHFRRVIRLHADNKAAVDLDLAGRNALEIVQRGHPSTIIVDRQVYPHVAQLPQGSKASSSIANRRCFSHFESEMFSIKTMFGQQLSNGHCKSWIIE